VQQVVALLKIVTCVQRCQNVAMTNFEKAKNQREIKFKNFSSGRTVNTLAFSLVK